MTAVQSDEMLVKHNSTDSITMLLSFKMYKSRTNMYRNPAKRKKKEEYLILSKSIHKYTVKNFILQIQP